MTSKYRKPRCGECGSPTVGRIRDDLVPEFACERPGCNGAWAAAREDGEAQLAAFVDELCGRFKQEGWLPWEGQLCQICGGFYLQNEKQQGHVCREIWP